MFSRERSRALGMRDRDFKLFVMLGYHSSFCSYIIYGLWYWFLHILWAMNITSNIYYEFYFLDIVLSIIVFYWWFIM